VPTISNGGLEGAADGPTGEGFEAVRAAVGNEIELCIDVHTRLNPADALWLCNELAPFRPYFVEDPLRVENPQTYRNLRTRTSVPLAVGEQYSSKWEFRQIIEEELADFARVDLCIVGGITEARKIAGWCETHYIDLAVHNPIGPVATSACKNYRADQTKACQMLY
jgi:L-alanine-DL-glutamate epimerase-like enolase superfamily enzyme